MARVAYVIRVPQASGATCSIYKVGVQEAGGTSVTEPIIEVKIEERKFTDCTAAEETALGAVTITALQAVTAYRTKTEI